MDSVADIRFACDVFWSRFNAQFSQEHLHNARFAKLHEIKHMLGKHRALSLLLGIGPHERPIRVLPTPTKPELGNIIDLGPPRCGKSNREKGQLLSWHASAFVNDIKGELRRATAGFRALLGKTYTIDIAGRGNLFDPLEGRITERELYSAAHQLLHNPNDKETYFTERATKMLTQLFLAAREETRLARLARPAAKTVRPLPYVGQLVKLGLNQVAERLNRVSPHIANAFLEAEYTPFKDFEESKSRSDAWTTLSSRLYPILTDDIIRSFDGSDFTARDLLFSAEPITVYFCWPEAELSSLTPLIRLVWESLMYDLITTYDLVHGAGCHDILLSLDEAGRTGLSQLPELAATVNGRGLSISMSGQSFEQFKSLYGEYRAKSLLNNMDTQIYHRQASFDTARELSGWLGYKSGWASSQSKHGDAHESEGKQEREIPLLTARQIAQLSDDDILILHRNIPPVRAKRFALESFPALAKRLNIDPPPLPALPAPIQHPRFPLWDRRLVAPGEYRLAYRALGYPIPLPATQ